MTETLDDDQGLAFAKFKEGKSIVILGGGGSGKSVLLNAIITYARKEIGGFPIVSSCALSNHAAEAINGRTIHSLFGAPPFWPFSATLWDIIRKRKSILQCLTRIKVLIIDEITLLSDRMLDSLDVILRNAVSDRENSNYPFGGRQIVFAGDPFQLEPIVDKSLLEKVPVSSSSYLAEMCIEEYNRRPPGPVHKSLAWFLSFGFGSGIVVFLHRNHRQNGDDEFFSILSRMRVGNTTNSDIERLNMSSATCPDIPTTHTRICLRRRTVAAVNKEMLERITGRLFKNVAADKVMSDIEGNVQCRLNSAALPVLEVKEGSDLILTTAVSNYSPGTRVCVRSVSEISEDGLAFKTLRVLEYSSNKEFFIKEHCFKVRTHDCTIIATRTQFPAIPAYAMTVHRSQGMTLRGVSVKFNENDPWRPFGMAYVILSRCTSLSGLWVKGLQRKHITVSPDSCALMKKIFLLKKHCPTRVIGNGDFYNEDAENAPTGEGRIENDISGQNRIQSAYKRIRI